MGRLLIVDDAMLMRRMIRDVASEAGWEVVAMAKDGREGVALFAEHRPDLVTMDVVMPEMGGLDALRRIKELDPDARVVMVTALDQKPTIEEAIRAGALDFIVKPFDRPRIVNLLARIAATTPSREPGPRAERSDLKSPI